MLVHHINPNMENEKSVNFVDLDDGWYIINLRDIAEQPTVVGPFDSHEDVLTYCDDTTSLFDTERIIKVV